MHSSTLAKVQGDFDCEDHVWFESFGYNFAAHSEFSEMRVWTNEEDLMGPNCHACVLVYDWIPSFKHFFNHYDRQLPC